MGNFKPISMRCTKEQYDAIVPKLRKYSKIKIVSAHLFNLFEYLTNCYNSEPLHIGSTTVGCGYIGRETYEEWNEDFFLQCCGIETESFPNDWYIFVNKDNIEMISDWRNSVCGNNYYNHCLDTNCHKIVLSKHHSDTSHYCSENYFYHHKKNHYSTYQEITTEQFIKHVLKQESNKMNTKVNVTEVLKIHMVACTEWKSKMVEYLSRVDNEQMIEFTKDEIKKMFSAATPEQKPLLEEIFGKQLEPIDWNRLKTGSIVKIKKTDQFCSSTKNFDFDEPVEVVFFRTPYGINGSNKFFKDSIRNLPGYCTFHQDSEYILFAADKKIDYITEVIEY